MGPGHGQSLCTCCSASEPGGYHLIALVPDTLYKHSVLLQLLLFIIFTVDSCLISLLKYGYLSALLKLVNYCNN